MAITFGEGGLLQYDAMYSVLICQECKYAIQKSALGSHLLRHKIYRGERQRLMSSIARLQLLEPDDVQLPIAGSTPVSGLPIIAGYKCTANSCGSLCASTKRMRRHWSERHSVSDPPDPFSSPVNLQTFFRGTKIKYFEVGSVTSNPERHQLNVEATSAPRTQTSAVALSSPCNLDLETLRYFHHFTTITCLTLPAEHHESARYWQVDVVAQALQRRWLMFGLLSISASHLATLSTDETVKQVHEERSTWFLQDFSTGWEEVKRNLAATEVEGAKLGAQIICIQRCCKWMSESTTFDPGIVTEWGTLTLHSFMTTVQGCANLKVALNSAVNSEGTLEETAIPPLIGLRQTSNAAVPDNVPPWLLECLRTLPYRMAEVLEKPDVAQDFFAALAAVEALVECCSMSYASDELDSVWMGLVSWLTRLSSHFNQMLRQQHPAALIVFAHWLWLIERAEQHFWFLKGSATKVLRLIVEQLPENRAVRSLVENLLS